MPRGVKGGFPTYWTTYGQGPRQALMIHCSLVQSAVWGGLARHLSGALTMTAFDLPGHGRSGDWDGHGEIQGVTARIAADIADGPMDVIGHSFGATVALRMAVETPALIRSLVLIEPVFFAAAFAADPQMRAAHAEDERDFIGAMEAGDHLAAARAFLALWGNGTPWSELREAERSALAAQMPLIAAATPALYDDAGGMLAPGVLEAVEVPVLLIEGGASPQVIGAINAALAARLPNAQRSVIVGAGHMAPLSHPAQVSAEVLQFLR